MTKFFYRITCSWITGYISNQRLTIVCKKVSLLGTCRFVRKSHTDNLLFNQRSYIST